jgi:outer membrane protein TolC
VAEESVRIAREYEGQLQRAVEIGLALKGEALRVRTQAQRAELALRQALAAQRVASARLAEVLTLDPKTPLVARDAELVSLSLVDEDSAVAPLVQQALAARPEVKAAQARLAASKDAKDGAVIGPFIPSLGASAFLGALGGGPRGTPAELGSRGTTPSTSTGASAGTACSTPDTSRRRGPGWRRRGSRRRRRPSA